jgi:hypothetical protein
MLLTEPFLSAEIDYRRERAMGGRGTHTSVPVRSRRRPTRTRRARTLVHRLATGH